MDAMNLEPASLIRDDERWVPASVARQMMGHGKHKFYDLIRAGEIDARKDGGRTVVSLSSIRNRMNNLPKAASKAA